MEIPAGEITTNHVIHYQIFKVNNANSIKVVEGKPSPTNQCSKRRRRGRCTFCTSYWASFVQDSTNSEISVQETPSPSPPTQSLSKDTTTETNNSPNNNDMKNLCPEDFVDAFFTWDKSTQKRIMLDLLTDKHVHFILSPASEVSTTMHGIKTN